MFGAYPSRVRFAKSDSLTMFRFTYHAIVNRNLVSLGSGVGIRRGCHYDGDGEFDLSCAQ